MTNPNNYREQLELQLGRDVKSTGSKIIPVSNIEIPKGWNNRQAEFFPQSELTDKSTYPFIKEFMDAYSDVKGFKQCGVIARTREHSNISPDNVGLVTVRAVIEDGSKAWDQKYVVVVRVLNAGIGEDKCVPGDMAIIDIVSRNRDTHSEHKDIVGDYMKKLGLDWYIPEQIQEACSALETEIDKKRTLLDTLSSNDDQYWKLHEEVSELQDKLNKYRSIVDPGPTQKVNLLKMTPAMIAGGWMQKVPNSEEGSPNNAKLVVYSSSGDFGNYIWGEDVNELVYSLLGLLRGKRHADILIEGHPLLNILLDTMAVNKGKDDFYNILSKKLFNSLPVNSETGKREQPSRSAVSGIIHMYAFWRYQRGDYEDYVEAIIEAQKELGKMIVMYGIEYQIKRKS